jgi:pyruvate formate lyase activating enzyme
MPDGSVLKADFALPSPATRRLRVGGLAAFSMTDWPGRLAAVLFLQGCPWRCGYCHNPHLLAARGKDEQNWDAILTWLRTRCGLLEAVVFSGGEPTAQSELGAAIGAVRELGFAIGLHTGGAYPRRLARIIDDVDWIGFDLKAPFDDYAEVTGIRGSGAAALASLDIVRKAGVAFEVRTTVHPELTSSSALVALARELADRGIRRWVLQPFRTAGCANNALIASAASGARIADALVIELSAEIPEIVVR